MYANHEENVIEKSHLGLDSRASNLMAYWGGRRLNPRLKFNQTLSIGPIMANLWWYSECGAGLLIGRPRGVK